MSSVLVITVYCKIIIGIWVLIFSSDFCNAQFHVEGERLVVRRTKKMSLTFITFIQVTTWK